MIQSTNNMNYCEWWLQISLIKKLGGGKCRITYCSIYLSNLAGCCLKTTSAQKIIIICSGAVYFSANILLLHNTDKLRDSSLKRVFYPKANLIRELLGKKISDRDLEKMLERSGMKCMLSVSAVLFFWEKQYSTSVAFILPALGSHFVPLNWQENAQMSL